MQNLEELKSAIPDYAKDVKINLGSLVSQENQVLSAKQIYGAALTSAYATKEKSLIQVMENEVQNILSEAEIKAGKTATSLMATYQVP